MTADNPPSIDPNSGRASFASASAAVISVAIIAYVAVRAATLSITHDEALTYFWHVAGDWLSIVSFQTSGMADNNHVLNTLLGKVSVELFGVSELTLRLPALLGCVLFFVGLNLCLRRIVPGWRQVLGVLALGLNPYVLDFLGLARGYALGLGFTMVGLAAMLTALAAPPGKVRVGPAMLSVVLFAFAALSNLSFLLVMCGGLAVVSAPLLYSTIFGQARVAGEAPPLLQFLKIVAVALPFLAYLALPVHIIQKNGFFENGGHSGFWTDTVGSLVTGTVYQSPWFGERGGFVDVWIVAVLAVVALALPAMVRTNWQRFVALAAIVAMTGLIALASWLQNVVLDVALLEGRRGIYLIPLFMLCALMLSNLPRSLPRWLVAAGFLVGAVVPGALGVHGLMSANLSHTLDWKYEAATRDTMVAVKDWIDERKPDAPLYMRVDWIFEPASNFYRQTLALESSLMPLDRDGIDGPADLYYIPAFRSDEIAKFGVEPLRHSPVSESMLYYRVK